MPQLKLNYFDFHGGRAEPVRLALHIGGIAFEDHRFTFPEFAEFRKTTPFGQVPTLEVDGLHLTQCDAMLRYAGKLANLYPTDPLQALLCDEVAYVVEEARSNGSQVPVTEQVLGFYRELVGLGRNRYDTSSLVTRLPR